MHAMLFVNSFFFDNCTPQKLRICMLYRGFSSSNCPEFTKICPFYSYRTHPCLSKTWPNFVKKDFRTSVSCEFCEIFYCTPGKFCNFFRSINTINIPISRKIFLQNKDKRTSEQISAQRQQINTPAVNLTGCICIKSLVFLLLNLNIFNKFF